MYRVVLAGLKHGIPADQGRVSLATLFKVTPERVDELIAQNRHVVKTGLSDAQSRVYLRAVTAAGGECFLEDEETDEIWVPPPEPVVEEVPPVDEQAAPDLPADSAPMPQPQAAPVEFVTAPAAVTPLTPAPPEEPPPRLTIPAHLPNDGDEPPRKASTPKTAPPGWKDRLESTLWSSRQRKLMSGAGAALLLGALGYGVWQGLFQPKPAPVVTGAPSARGVVTAASAPASVPASASAPASAAMAASASASALANASAPVVSALVPPLAASFPAMAAAAAAALKAASAASAMAQPTASSSGSSASRPTAGASNAAMHPRPAEALAQRKAATSMASSPHAAPTTDHAAVRPEPRQREQRPPVPDEAFEFNPQWSLSSVTAQAQVASVRTGEARCPRQYLVVFSSPSQQWKPKSSELFGNCNEPSQVDQGEDEIVMRFAPSRGHAAAVVRISAVAVRVNGRRLSVAGAPAPAH